MAVEAAAGPGTGGATARHDAPSPRKGRSRSELTVIAVVLAASGLVFLGLLGFGAEPEAATVGLAAAAAALLICLRRLYLIAQALARRPVDVVLDIEGALVVATQREAREERRRVLRAIKELDFDHAMGKLSDDDYREVRDGYQLRAVEVMRALASEPELHPELQRVLDGRAGAGDGPVEKRCPSCDGDNDADAKFCKHCGVGLGQ